MRLTDEELGKILGHRTRRDMEAFMVGVATMEWRRHCFAAEVRVQTSEADERRDPAAVALPPGVRLG